jgi:hypothetical protein
MILVNLGYSLRLSKLDEEVLAKPCDSPVFSARKVPH